MLTDPREQHIAAAFKAARPRPRMGWDARALAALTDIRPRRHPNLLTFIIVVALILLLAAGVFAAVRYFFVEGTLRFHDVTFEAPDDPANWRALGAHFFSGELEWESETDPSVLGGDISPDGDRVAFSTAEAGEWPPTGGDILLADSDWSDEVNLTEIAGLGGVNCRPKWSPDGAMIAFVHSDPVEGELPCDAGEYLWVMFADGSGAHQVTPEGAPPIYGFTWSPDSSRLAGRWTVSDGPAAFTTDIWGTDIRPLPNVSSGIDWSPDGAMLVSRGGAETEVDGQPGQRNYLVLTNADGGDPRVLVEQFVSDADAVAHLARYGHRPEYRALSDDVRLNDVRFWAGPCNPVWSPDSKKIAFLGALPFDPDGLYFKDQIEVWVYDLDTDELIRVTNDDVAQTSLSWK